MIVKLFDSNYILTNKNDITSFEKYDRNTVFQYADWLEIAIKEISKNPFGRLSEVKFAILEANGTCKGIAPIIVRNRGKARGVYVLGTNFSADYVDIILEDDVTEKDVRFFVDEILKQTGQSEFHFSALPEGSITYKALCGAEICNCRGKGTCVEIKLCQDDYEGYFATLKKSVRQNIRTANNRLLSDGKVGVLNIYDNNVDKKLAKTIFRLYEKRVKNQNSCRKGLRYSFYRLKRAVSLASFNFVEYAMQNNKNSVIVTYEIDGEIASFGHALKNRAGNLFFIQVSFNDKFRRYSPGMLMFTEFFKKCYSDGSRITIDLTVGTEQYKYDLGGEEKYIYRVVYQRR